MFASVAWDNTALPVFMSNLLLVSHPLQESWSCLGWVRCAWIMFDISRLNPNTCFEHSFVCELFFKKSSWLESRCRLREMWLIFIDDVVTHSFCHTHTQIMCNSWMEESDPFPPAGLTLLTSPRFWNFLTKFPIRRFWVSARALKTPWELSTSSCSLQSAPAWRRLYAADDICVVLMAADELKW